jgi:hypothetical protein
LDRKVKRGADVAESLKEQSWGRGSCEFRCILFGHLIPHKGQDWHPVGKIKYIHMKATRKQTAYGRDEQMENAVI